LHIYHVAKLKLAVNITYYKKFKKQKKILIKRAGLEFEREKEQTIYYESFEVGTRRADFVVENQIIVELKAIINLEDVHLAQAKNYVVAYDFPIGLLINFGAASLQFKKVYNSKYNKVSESGF
jgi:GxxExxY protein